MRKTWLLIMAAVFCGSLWAAPETPAQTAPEKPAHPRRSKGMKHYYWRAFSRMTPAERKAMMELQVKDPAAFHQKMRAATEALRAADKARRQKIDALAERCRTGSEAEKKAAREELTQIFRAGYMKRLADSRKHLQEMEARMKKIAETLEKKEANADAEIRILVENCIQGIKPQGPRPGRPGFPGPGTPDKR